MMVTKEEREKLRVDLGAGSGTIENPSGYRELAIALLDDLDAADRALATAREDASEMEKKAIAEGSEALALRAEVAALKAAAQWREMEDAPRDGTWILVLAKKESRAEGRGDVVRFIIDAPPGAFRWRARDWFGFFDDELVGWLPIPEIVGATV